MKEEFWGRYMVLSKNVTINNYEKTKISKICRFTQIVY